MRSVYSLVTTHAYKNITELSEDMKGYTKAQCRDYVNQLLCKGSSPLRHLSLVLEDPNSLHNVIRSVRLFKIIPEGVSTVSGLYERCKEGVFVSMLGCSAEGYLKRLKKRNIQEQEKLDLTLSVVSGMLDDLYFYRIYITDIRITMTRLKYPTTSLDEVVSNLTFVIEFLNNVTQNDIEQLYELENK